MVLKEMRRRSDVANSTNSSSVGGKNGKTPICLQNRRYACFPLLYVFMVLGAREAAITLDTSKFKYARLRVECERLLCLRTGWTPRIGEPVNETKDLR